MNKTKKIPVIIRYIPAILIFLLILGIAIYMFSDVNRTTTDESLAMTENNIRRAVITCYAQEGQYPPSIDYLKENYGLYVGDEYLVHYDMFASNIMPDITVMRKQVAQ